MQINAMDLNAQLASMREYSKNSGLLEPGVFMSYFSVRANISRGFDILVRKSVRNQLPSKQMPLMNLDKWQIDYLSEFDGMSVNSCLKSLKSKLLTPTLSSKEETYATQLFHSLEDLRDEINDPSFLEAVLVGKPVSAPCRGVEVDAQPGQAQIIAFRNIVPIHSRAPNPHLAFIPLSFFKAQQHVYKNSPDHAVFARRMHREFGEFLAQAPSSAIERESDLLSPNSLKFGGSNRSLSDRSIGPPSPVAHSFQLSGNRSLTDVRCELDHQLPTLIPRAKVSDSRLSARFWKDSSKPSEKSGGKTTSKLTDDSCSEHQLIENPFAAILFTQEVTVEVQEVSEDEATKRTETGLEMLDLRSRRGVEAPARLQLGPQAAASTELEDPNTYVDILFAACVETR
jgi:hypothetical protein